MPRHTHLLRYGTVTTSLLILSETTNDKDMVIDQYYQLCGCPFNPSMSSMNAAISLKYRVEGCSLSDLLKQSISSHYQSIESSIFSNSYILNSYFICASSSIIDTICGLQISRLLSLSFTADRKEIFTLGVFNAEKKEFIPEVSFMFNELSVASITSQSTFQSTSQSISQSSSQSKQSSSCLSYAQVHSLRKRVLLCDGPSVVVVDGNVIYCASFYNYHYNNYTQLNCNKISNGLNEMEDLPIEETREEWQIHQRRITRNGHLAVFLSDRLSNGEWIIGLCSHPLDNESITLPSMSIDVLDAPVSISASQRVELVWVGIPSLAVYPSVTNDDHSLDISPFCFPEYLPSPPHLALFGPPSVATLQVPSSTSHHLPSTSSMQKLQQPSASSLSITSTIAATLHFPLAPSMSLYVCHSQNNQIILVEYSLDSSCIHSTHRHKDLGDVLTSIDPSLTVAPYHPPPPLSSITLSALPSFIIFPLYDSPLMDFIVLGYPTTSSTIPTTPTTTTTLQVLSSHLNKIVFESTCDSEAVLGDYIGAGYPQLAFIKHVVSPVTTSTTKNILNNTNNEYKVLIKNICILDPCNTSHWNTASTSAATTMSASRATLLSGRHQNTDDIVHVTKDKGMTSIVASLASRVDDGLSTLSQNQLLFDDKQRMLNHTYSLFQDVVYNINNHDHNFNQQPKPHNGSTSNESGNGRGTLLNDLQLATEPSINHPSPTAIHPSSSIPRTHASIIATHSGYLDLTQGRWYIVAFINMNYRYYSSNASYEAQPVSTSHRRICSIRLFAAWSHATAVHLDCETTVLPSLNASDDNGHNDRLYVMLSGSLSSVFQCGHSGMPLLIGVMFSLSPSHPLPLSPPPVPSTSMIHPMSIKDNTITVPPQTITEIIGTFNPFHVTVPSLTATSPTLLSFQEAFFTARSMFVTFRDSTLLDSRTHVPSPIPPSSSLSSQSSHARYHTFISVLSSVCGCVSMPITAQSPYQHHNEPLNPTQWTVLFTLNEYNKNGQDLYVRQQASHPSSIIQSGYPSLPLWSLCITCPFRFYIKYVTSNHIEWITLVPSSYLRTSSMTLDDLVQRVWENVIMYYTNLLHSDSTTIQTLPSSLQHTSSSLPSSTANLPMLTINILNRSTWTQLQRFLYCLQQEIDSLLQFIDDLYRMGVESTKRSHPTSSMNHLMTSPLNSIDTFVTAFWFHRLYCLEGATDLWMARIMMMDAH